MSAYSSNSTIPGAAATEPLVAKPQGRIRKGVVVAAAVASLMLVGGLAGLAAVARRPPARRRVGRRLTVDESPAQADASRRFLSFIAPSIFELDLPRRSGETLPLAKQTLKGFQAKAPEASWPKREALYLNVVGSFVPKL